MINEEYAYVLDYIEADNIEDAKAELIGSSFFVLLKATLKNPVSIRQLVYIGKGERNEIDRISGRLTLPELSSTSETELLEIIKEIITKNETRFLDFFNNARPLSLRRHQIELLPNVGKKTLEVFLAEREKEHFKTLDEINKRVPNFPNVFDALSTRIFNEISGEDIKYFLFVPRFVSQKQKPKARRY